MDARPQDTQTEVFNRRYSKGKRLMRWKQSSASQQTEAEPNSGLENSDPPTEQEGSPNKKGYALLLAWGVFITAIGQPKLIGLLPLRVLLQTELHVEPKAMAGFFAVGSLAFYFKPLAGFLVDSFPLWGRRRKPYLLLGAGGAGILWLLLGTLPKTYLGLLCIIVTINVFIMVANTVIGGLIAEEGQRQGTTGRLSSLFQSLQLITSLIIGPLGGFLAVRAFGLTSLTAALLLFSLIPVVLRILHEPPSPQGRDTDVWDNARQQFGKLFHSSTLWKAAGFLFLALFGPAFVSPLFYHQTQTLRFTPQVIGNLGVVYACMGLLATLLYSRSCKIYPMRLLLGIGIVGNGFGILAYLGYQSLEAAIVIEGVYGLLNTLLILSLLDLAARAAPAGSESLGYAVMTSLYNVAVNFSDVFGSWLLTAFSLRFSDLIWLHGSTRLLALGVLPFLPQVLLLRRDGEAR